MSVQCTCKRKISLTHNPFRLFLFAFSAADCTGDNISLVVVTNIQAFLVDKAGRRLMLLIPELVMAVDLIFLTISFSVQVSFINPFNRLL
jgi:hypothetical protein